MENTIDQFMWGYQQHYLISIRLLAERCFNRLAEDIFNNVFIVGVLNEGEESRHQICIEPEDSVYKQSMFLNAIDLSTQLEAVSPDKKILHSHPIAQENHEKRIKARAKKDAILKCIEQNNYKNELKSYVSYPTTIEKYSIFVCLQLNLGVYDAFYKLKKNSH